MKIVIFGASGGLGRQVVLQALDAGHKVTAFVRNPEKLGVQHPNLKVCQGDVRNFETVGQALAGQDAVISALGPSRPTDPDMMETAARNILAAMQIQGVKRLLSTTGAGVWDPRDQPRLIDKAMKALVALMAGEVLRDSQANVNLIRASNLDWTIIRFPRLIDGTRTGSYRIGYLGQNSGLKVTRADGADFILRELEEGEHIHKAPMVSY